MALQPVSEVEQLAWLAVSVMRVPSLAAVAACGAFQDHSLAAAGTAACGAAAIMQDVATDLVGRT